jgi:hypothetical protein
LRVQIAPKLDFIRRDKNQASSICTSTYYSEKEPKYVADFFGRDILFTTHGFKVHLVIYANLDRWLQAGMSMRSSNANQVGDPPIMLRAHPAHDDDVLRSLEQAVPAAMLDDARGEGGADARQSLQFFDRGGVDVDALFVLRMGN